MPHDAFLVDKIELLSEPMMASISQADNLQSIWVNYAATLWKAKLYNGTCPERVQAGQVVQVVGLQGTTLLITFPGAVG
ncbi:MAG: hypothetical protein HC881_14130 [Leptolyngbyaceae cyanobacterium SL_7_1]|nr:hypothetical protein [Leptolyngbyaceae cyanobacterium SL_7_1]